MRFVQTFFRAMVSIVGAVSGRQMLVVLALPLAVAACSGGGDANPTPNTVLSPAPAPNPNPTPPPDTTPPTLAISSPNGAVTVTTNTISVSGTANDGVGVTQVTWQNSAGGNGTASGTSSWSIASVTLQSGGNVISVTARDAANNFTTRSVTVTYSPPTPPPPPPPPDTTAPTVNITSPSAASTVTTSTISVSGNASDNVGVTLVTWQNDRGGNGTASGLANWSVASVALQSGANVITVTARDAANNVSNRSVTVTYSVPPPPPPPPPPTGSNAVSVQIQNLSSASQTDVPVSFAQPFKAGQIGSGQTVSARTTGSSSVGIPAQVDIKARHADGSVRHAVITLRLASLSGSTTQGVELVAASPGSASPVIQLSELLATNFDAVLSLNISGTVYTASARDLLQAGPVKSWLSGPMVGEWLVAAPVKAGSSAHPHLSARFAIRAYKNAGGAIDSVRADVTVENNWAYEPAPRNFVYTATVSVGGSTVYTKSNLTHYVQARWHKQFWWGKAPNVLVKHDRAYLMSSGVVPNYDPALTIPESSLSGLASSFSGSVIEPMGPGLTEVYMPETGARPDLGPLPRWTAMYLISQDSRAKNVTLGSGDLAGSWPIHYRDKTTDLPVSLNKYPYMTLLGNPTDTYNPSTGQYESFPSCGGSCATGFTPDSSHQPSLAYVPYLVTGDHYYLEELQFWANWNVLQAAPTYRELSKGLLKWDQVRGQAWSLRTLGQAAFITPDSDPMKSYFQTLLTNNLSWYRQTYPDNGGANVLGIIANGYAFEYQNGTGIAAWQDDFFTWSVGHVAALGYADAQAMLVWKARFPISRMVGTGYCWVYGAPYETIVKSSSGGAVFSSIAQVYTATAPSNIQSLQCGSAAMASALGLAVGEMPGYAYDPTGYPSNLQPALAVAADSGAANGAAAWTQFMSRSVKPDYRDFPNFAIVPRQ